MYRKTTKIYQMTNNIPNDHNRYQMAKNISKFFIPRPPKTYRNLDCWYENLPSGNPDLAIVGLVLVQVPAVAELLLHEAEDDPVREAVVAAQVGDVAADERAPRVKI
jgi:hypothetical protein